MAAGDATPIPVKNQAYRVTFPILDADGDLVTAATGLDSEVSKDGATFADCTSEATEIATGSGMYFLDLTATEMNADTVAIIVKTTSSGAKTTPMVLYPNKAGGLAVNVTAWAGTATATNQIALKTALAKTTDITGFNDISAANVQTELGTYGALKPTVAARTLDVSTGGEAGIDWANVGTPATTVNLSATTVATVTNGVALTAGERTTLTGVIWNTLTSALTTVGSIGKLLVDNINATISSRSTYAGGDTAGTTTLLSRIASNLTITAGKVDVNDKTGFALTSAYDAAKTAATQASVDAMDAVTDKLNTAMELDGAVYRFTTNALEQAPVGGGGGTGDASQATLLAVKAKTDALPTDPADASDIAASFTTVNTKLDAISTGLPLDAGELNAIADALLKRDWNSVSGEAAYSALNAFRILRNVWSTAGNTLTVKKEDGSTTAWTRTLSTDPAAQPITGTT